MIVRLDRRLPHSCRVYVRGVRVHHGLSGLILVAIGAMLMAHDVADVHEWIKPDRYDPETPYRKLRAST